MQNKILRCLSIDEMIPDEYRIPNEIDIVISVGGFYGFFVIGTDKIIRKLEKQGKLVVKRYAGSSVGAICAMLMGSGVTGDTIIQIYNNLIYNRYFFKSLKQEILQLLPPDAYLKCNDKVYIACTEITWFGFKKTIISQFTSNEDLVDATLASSNMPFLISPFLYYKFRGKYFIDGCFSAPLPIFKDYQHRQLLIKLYKIKYYTPYSYYPIDPSIEALVVKGAVETDKFLSGSDSTIETLEWFNERKYNNRYRRYILRSLGMITIFYLIYTNGFRRKN
jgi:predicted acylesterase/phospholipase RssA